MPQDTQTTLPETDRPENRIVFRVDDQLNESIRLAAIRRKVTISDLCTAALREYISQEAR